jgi:hypothetical protein
MEKGGWVGPGLSLDFRKRDKSLAPAVKGTLDCAASILVTILTYSKRLDIFSKTLLHLLRYFKVLPSEALKSELMPL